MIVLYILTSLVFALFYYNEPSSTNGITIMGFMTVICSLATIRMRMRGGK